VDGKATSGVAFWDGTSWIPNGTLSEPFYLNAFSTYEGKLYGFNNYFSNSEEASNLVEYDEEENNWVEVPNSEVKVINGDGDLKSGYIFKALAYKNELYVVGDFDEIDGRPIKNIAKWNGSTWSALLENDSQAAPFKFEYLTDMVMYNDELIVCGIMHNNSGGVYNSIAKWNNENWDNLDGGLLYNSAGGWNSYELEVFQGALYMGGPGSKVKENDIGYLLHKWNGTFWEGVAGFEQQVSSETFFAVTALEIFGDFLVVGREKSGETILYNGTSAQKIEEDLQDAILSFETFNNQLYATGFFRGGSFLNRVFRLGSLVNSDSSSVKMACALFPNPSSGALTLSYHLENNSGLVIRIYDLVGKLLFNETFNDVEGDHVRSLDVSNFAKGSYMVKMISKEFEETKILILE